MVLARLLGDECAPLFPNIKHDIAEGRKEIVLRLDAGKERHEFLLQLLFRYSLAVHGALLVVAMVIGMMAVPPARRAPGEEAFAGIARDAAPQRELRVEAVVLHGPLHLARFHEDDAVIFLCRDHRDMQAVLVLPGKGIFKDASVEFQIFSEDAVHQLDARRYAPDVGQTPRIKQFHKLDLRAEALGVVLQSPLDDREYLFVRRVGYGFLFSLLFREGTDIAQRRFPRVQSLVDLLAHAVAASLFSDRVVVFGCARQDGFDEFLRGLVADRLGYGMERRAIFHKDFPHRKMVFGVPREAVHAQDDEGMDLTFPLPAEFQGRQKFLPVVQTQVFRRFSLFAEHFDNVNVPLRAIFLTELFLEFERGALHLLVA